MVQQSMAFKGTIRINCAVKITFSTRVVQSQTERFEQHPKENIIAISPLFQTRRYICLFD